MNPHRLIPKRLITAIVAVGVWVGGAAPAAAEPNPDGAEPDPFGGLGCSCREAPPPDSRAVQDEIRRGIREGLSVWVPGLPPPSLPGPPPP